MTRTTAFLLLISLELAVLCQAAEPSKRIPPPKWPQDVLDAFFDDAREHLVGARPKRADTITKQLANTDKAAPSVDSTSKWSTLIDAETLISEIKRLNIQLAGHLKKSSNYQGGGNLACRRDFGLASVLFGVLAEFDPEDPSLNRRWQRSASLMQDLCFQANKSCQTASAQSYAVAQAVRADLEELIRGQAPNGPSSPTQEKPLVDRTQLMQSMELILKERLSLTLASSKEFRKRSQLAAEQGQLLAVLAEIIQAEGYEYRDDDTYLEEARQLRQASSELSQATKEKDYEAVRAAAGRASQSCSRCHEGYRG